MDTSRGARDGSVTLCAVDVLGEGQSCSMRSMLFDAYMASLPCNMRVTAICQTVSNPNVSQAGWKIPCGIPETLWRPQPSQNSLGLCPISPDMASGSH